MYLVHIESILKSRCYFEFTILNSTISTSFYNKCGWRGRFLSMWKKEQSKVEPYYLIHHVILTKHNQNLSRLTTEQIWRKVLRTKLLTGCTLVPDWAVSRRSWGWPPWNLITCNTTLISFSISSKINCVAIIFLRTDNTRLGILGIRYLGAYLVYKCP